MAQQDFKPQGYLTLSNSGGIEIEINDDGNPFADWSSAKICCYQVAVSDGVVTMYTPYVASSALDYIDNIGKENDLLVDKATAADILMGVIE